MIEDKRKIVTQILGNYWQKGDEHLYHCPYCKHHKKKMSVNFANGFWKCWVCDMRGKNVYRIVRKFGSYQQREKYRELQGMVDLSDFEQLFKEYNEIEDKQIIELPKEFISLCNKDLPMHSTEPLRYLSSRGLTRLDTISSTASILQNKGQTQHRKHLGTYPGSMVPCAKARAFSAPCILARCCSYSFSGENEVDFGFLLDGLNLPSGKDPRLAPVP
jgi:hypothetical protein